MARVVFSLTDKQAAALVRLARRESLTGRGRAASLLENALYRRGFLEAGRLTDLGEAAASVATIILATASHTNGGQG